MKKIVLFFGILLFSFINNVFASSNNLINVTGVIKGDDGTYYNYLHLAIKDKNGIICKGETKQTFKQIDDLSDGYTTDILKVDNSGFLDFNCDRNRLLKNGKINPNVKLVVFSDGFYSIKDTYINISPNILKIYDNRIIIGNFKNLKTNFRIEIKKINNKLFNNFDSKIKKITKQLKIEEKNKEKNKDISNLKNVNLIIKNIPKSIELKYQYNNIIKEYDKNNKNTIIVRGNNIEQIKIGEKIFTNLKINNYNITIPYSSDMYKKDIKLSIIINNIPKIKKDIIIYIDGKEYIYQNNKLDILLTYEQIKKGISIKIGKYNIKRNIKKSVILKIDYKDIVKDNLKLKNIDNKTLILKLNTSLLDGLRRIVLNEQYENGGTMTKTFTVKDYFIDGKVLYLKYKSINESIPNNIIINNKKFSIKDISLNLKEFLSNKYK